VVNHKEKFGTFSFCNIYINDLPYFLNVNSNIYLYANDTKVFRHKSISQDVLLLEDDKNKLKNWTDEWFIKLNINKCKVVSYGRMVEILIIAIPIILIVLNLKNKIQFKI